MVYYIEVKQEQRWEKFELSHTIVKKNPQLETWVCWGNQSLTFESNRLYLGSCPIIVNDQFESKNNSLFRAPLPISIDFEIGSHSWHVKIPLLSPTCQRFSSP